MCNVSLINLTFSSWNGLLDHWSAGHTGKHWPRDFSWVETLCEPIVQNKRKSSSYTVQRNGGTIHSRSYLENSFLKDNGKPSHVIWGRNQRNRDEEAWTDMTALVKYLKGFVKAENFWVSGQTYSNNDDNNSRHWHGYCYVPDTVPGAFHLKLKATLRGRCY